MKYIGAITMILVGALLIGLAATIPGFAIVNITSTTSSVTYSQSSSYPTSTSPYSPTIFANSTSVTLTVGFSTGYDFSGVSSSGTYATGSVTIIDYNTSSTLGTYSTTWSIATKKSSVGTFYEIVASSSYTFNNPITGGTHVYEITWTSKLTYNAEIAGASSYTTGTISATGTTVYGKFSPVTVYPGYFVLQNCTSSWQASGNPYKLSFNSVINIEIPYTQPDAYLEFIYVEYNASGNTQAGFIEAYINMTTTGSAQWLLTNTTTYNNYPALYIHVKLPPGTYKINGTALYQYGQRGGVETLFEMSSSWNITQAGQITLNSDQLITYAVGAILIFAGAIDAWKWHI